MDRVHTADGVRKSAGDRVRPERIRPEIRAAAAGLGDGAAVAALWARCRSSAEHRYVARAWRRLVRRWLGSLAEWRNPLLPGVAAVCRACRLATRAGWCLVCDWGRS